MKIESAVGLLQPRQHHSSCTLIKAGFTVLVTLVSGYSFQSRCLAADPSVPQNLLTNSTYGTILGFDLRDERAPKATVLIMKPTGALNATVDLALPFKIQEPTPNEEALVRVGTFEHWTLVTYSELPSQRWPQQVSFFPKPDFMPDPPPQNTDLRGSLYLHNMGQVWRFLYRYPDVNHRNTLPSGSSNLTLRQFDAIAVAIPENAKRLEVRGKTAIPEHIAANQFARFYPPAATAPSEPFLEIMYELPLTAKQAIVVEYGVKFLLALSPILGLLLLRDRIQHPGVRRVAIVITVLIYVCALTALAVYAWRLGDVGIKVIMDLLLFALSGVVALMVFFIKGSIPQVAQVLNDAAQDGAGGAGDED